MLISGVKVCGEGFAMVARIAVNNVEIAHLREMMLCGVGHKHSRHTRVESATENCGKPRLLESLTVSPLPAVFKVSLILQAHS